MNLPVAATSLVFLSLAWVYAREESCVRSRSLFAATYAVGLYWLLKLWSTP